MGPAALCVGPASWACASLLRRLRWWKRWIRSAFLSGCRVESNGVLEWVNCGEVPTPFPWLAAMLPGNPWVMLEYPVYVPGVKAPARVSWAGSVAGSPAYEVRYYPGYGVPGAG